MKVNIIGPYPPPYGGVSVHIKRIKKYLNSKDVDVEIYNESKEQNSHEENIYSVKSYKRFIFKIPFLNGDIIHFHSINIKMRILLGVFTVFHNNIILTVHGENLHDQIEQANWIIKKLLLFSLKKISKIICVNSKTLEELCDLGVSSDKLIFLPAYINPIEEENDFKRIPDVVWNFINNSNFLISANGWIRIYKNEDLYGIDMLIELMRRLKSKDYDVSMFIALIGTDAQNQEEKSYYENLKIKIINYNLTGCIFLYETKDTEFYPILKKTNLLIRPTNTDGYAVSLAEALYYKVPSITSNLPNRPEGTIIFKSRDIQDLYIKTVKVIENYDLYKEKIRDIKIPSNDEKLLDIYKNLA